MVDFNRQDSAEDFLATLSFTTGRSIQDINCPDNMKIAPILLPHGVFVVIGGQLTQGQHYEIRKLATDRNVEAKSVCVAEEGSTVQREFLEAMSRLKEKPGVANENHIQKRKWWQFWKKV